MYRQHWTVLVAAAVALPLLNCNDSTTSPARAGVQVATEGLILHDVKTATELLSFIQAAAIGLDSARAIVSQECAQRGIALGRLLRTGGSLGADAFKPLNPLNPFCGCPAQPRDGAPAGHTCKLVRADCDSTGRSCAYQCTPTQTRT
ncbi:MAG: hypothetical protein ACT4P6_20035 [Gemmatimonadaceae bacterium]